MENRKRLTDYLMDGGVRDKWFRYISQSALYKINAISGDIVSYELLYLNESNSLEEKKSEQELSFFLNMVEATPNELDAIKNKHKLEKLEIEIGRSWYQEHKSSQHNINDYYDNPV